MRKRARLPKPLRNALISAAVLLLVLVGGGVAYTYILGQSGPGDAAKAGLPVTTADEPVFKPIKPAADAKESASVETITSPVARGTNSSVTIKTNAASKCTISVVYSDKASTDSGLVTKIADDYGVVSWTWTVGTDVPVGTWPVKVTCAYHTQTAVVQADLVVTNN